MKIKFVEAAHAPEAFSRKAWMEKGLSKEEAKRAVERFQSEKVFLSACGTYQANVTEVPPRPSGWPIPLTWISFKRRDREPIHDWRIVQAIKNGIIGEEREAVELYPAESRLVDTVNQYHLWALPAGMSFPFGFEERAVNETPLGASRQRPFSEQEETA